MKTCGLENCNPVTEVKGNFEMVRCDHCGHSVAHLITKPNGDVLDYKNVIRDWDRAMEIKAEEFAETL